MGSSRFARRYLGNRFFFLFLRVLRCFSSPGLPSSTYVFSTGYCPITGSGFPHSEISGSKLAYSSPEHIGVRSVLLRLLVPRHPPCALCNLIFTVVDKLRISSSAALSHILPHFSALRCSFGCLLELLASRQPLVECLHSHLKVI